MDELWIVNKLVRGRIICNFQRTQQFCLTDVVYYLYVHWTTIYYKQQVPDASDLDWA